MSSDEETKEPRPSDELRDIAASLRAYLEWQRDSGADGVPRGERALRARPEPSTLPSTAPVEQAPQARANAESQTARTDVGASRPSTAREPERERPKESAYQQPVVPIVGAPPPAHTPFSTEARSLTVLQETVSTCRACRLSETRTNTVFARGNPEATLAFIGEAPGADEDAQGLPFVGRAGQLLDKMIAAMGLDPERDVYVCNIVKCRPPDNRRPEPDELAACFPFLDEQLANVRPRVMVAMGNTAVAALFDTKMGITRVRGQWKLYKGRIPTMPTYHPSYLLRPSDHQLEAKRQCWEDLQAVMKELGLSRKPKT